jgi:uncharacterized protein (TIGR04255 family)
MLSLDAGLPLCAYAQPFVMFRDLDAPNQRSQITPVPLPLPEFQHPPLIEVVCGIQFEPINIQTVHLGDFWQKIRDRYPSFEDRPLLPTIVSDASGGFRHEQEFGYTDMPPLRRVFFVEKSKNFLLQISPSRFIANWRKMRDEDEYPRFSAAYENLTDGWRRFLEYAAGNELGHPRCNHYELTYINHILADNAGPLHEQASELFTLFRWPALDERLFESPLRGLSHRFQVRLKNDRGTLAIALRHGERQIDRKRTFILEFTAYGAADGDATDRDQWFSLAHEAIVETFASVTTKAAHERWGRMQ